MNSLKIIDLAGSFTLSHTDSRRYGSIAKTQMVSHIEIKHLIAVKLIICICKKMQTEFDNYEQTRKDPIIV